MAARLRIARQAWLHNVDLGLTGEMVFADGRFWQIVEGPCEVVLPLSARILIDPRHCDVAVRAMRAIAARRFSTWAAIGFGTPVHAPGLAANLSLLSVFAAQDAAAVALPAQGSLIG